VVRNLNPVLQTEPGQPSSSSGPAGDYMTDSQKDALNLFEKTTGKDQIAMLLKVIDHRPAQL